MPPKKQKKAGDENTQKRRSPRLAQKQPSPNATAKSPPRGSPAPASDGDSLSEPESPGPSPDECLWFGTGPIKQYKRWGPLEPSWAVDHDRIEEVTGKCSPWLAPGSGGWVPPEFEELKKLLEPPMMEWSGSYAVRKEDLESVEVSLSVDQKQAIMEELDGYCITKDLNTLVEYLPNGIHKLLPMVLIETLLCKAAFDTMFANPFFFIDTMDNQTAEVDKIPTSLGTELCKVWKHIRKVNIVGAEEWRRNTVRMFHDTYYTRCYNDSVGMRSIQHRKSVAKSLAEHVLSETHPMHPLLRPLTDPEEIQQRLGELLKVFDQLARVAVWTATENLGLLLTPINRLPPHDDEGPLSVPHWFNKRAEKGVPLTGRYPVLMTGPLIHRLSMSPTLGVHEYMVCPAEVVLSKPLRPDEIVEFEDDTCENWDIPRAPTAAECASGQVRFFKKPPSNITFPPKD